VTFHNNTAAYCGGAVDVSLSAVFELAYSNFTHNQAVNHNKTDGSGGAVSATDTGTKVRAENVTFHHNTAALGGGAVAAAYGSVLHMRNSSFYRNSVESPQEGGGGALFVLSNVAVKIMNSSFEHNSVAGGGGAVSVNYATTSDLKRPLVIRAHNKGSAAVENVGNFLLPSVVALHYCNFSFNSAGQQGGGFKVVSSNLTVENSMMDSNGCTGLGGTGGLLHMEGTTSQPVHVRLSSSTISNSVGDTGGTAFAVVTKSNNGTAGYSTLDWLNVTVTNSMAYLGQGMVLDGSFLRVNLTGSQVMLDSSSVIRKGDLCLVGDKEPSAGVCEMCPQHMYSLAVPPNTSCSICPPHAKCLGGAVIVADDGFFNTVNRNCTPSRITR
jgi:predicted outer membrane repeat protein